MSAATDSMTRDSTTNDAVMDLWNPNSPTVRLITRAAIVLAANAAASAPTSGRGHTSNPAAKASATIASSRKNGPLPPTR
ncbi:MAG TPA: hypothetical protein VGI66_11085 [Streptosporangiaceae bacterium]|jgi:hypothetical protein